MIVEVDGDIIVNVAPDPGYVHRGIEKIIELRNIIKSIPVIERPSIIDASNLNHAWVRSIEEIQGVEVPRRGQYLRTLLNEMNRIISHLYWLSIYGVFLGHTTMFMWPLGDRELFIDLAEKLTGARITYSYLVPGGVRRDLPPGFAEEAVKRTEYFEKRLKEYDRIFFNNPLFTSRAKGIGVLSKEKAIELGCTGPTLRGSGVDADLRKDEPYAAYPELDFEVSTRPDGDARELQDNTADRQEDSFRTNQEKGTDSFATWCGVWKGQVGPRRMQLLSYRGGRRQALSGTVYHRFLPEYGRYSCGFAWKPFGGHAYCLVEYRLLAGRGGQVDSNGSDYRQSEGCG